MFCGKYEPVKTSNRAARTCSVRIMLTSVILTILASVLLFNGLTCISPQGPQASGTPWTWKGEVGPDGLPIDRPLILGHRGSCGMYPEHTLLSYVEAAVQGADLIECDMVLTKDLQIVCSHESWIGEVSNVNSSNLGPPHPDFSDRLRTYNMDDDDPSWNWNDKGNITDFFTIDFTLEELRTLRRRQANKIRDPSYDWSYGFVTLDEYVAVAKEYNVGIYPELKQLTAVNRILKSRNLNVTFEDIALEALARHGYSEPEDPCFLQSFELSSLEKLASKTRLRRILLLNSRPKATLETFERVKSAGIYGVGIDKLVLVEVQGEGDERPGHIKKIHYEIANQIKDLGIALHAYTFRNEPAYLNWDDGQDFTVEYDRFLGLGVEAFFTDFPASLSNYFSLKKGPTAATP